MSTSAFPTQSWWCSKHGTGIGGHCPFCEDDARREAIENPLSPTNPLNRIATALERIATAVEAEWFAAQRSTAPASPAPEETK